MLVLSRRQDELIRFPNLGIEVRVLRLAGNVVRLGVEAPSHIRVMRGELASHDGESGGLPRGEESRTECPPTEPHIDELFRQFRHDIRDQLNAAYLMLQVLQKRITAQEWDKLEPLVERALAVFMQIDSELSTANRPRVQSLPAKPRVLIVEDNKNEGELLAELLIGYGCDVELVGNGFEALHSMRHSGRPDVVLLDMNMPIADGPTTVRMIRERSEFDGLRVYGVSGLSMEEAGLTIGPYGVDRWYTKPVNAKALAEGIRAAVASQSLSAYH
jgi:carbon storage regulator CsrA